MAGAPEDSGKLFILTPEGELLHPRGNVFAEGAPGVAGPFARAVSANKSPLHLVWDGGSLKIGSLVYTCALGTRFLGKRYVLITEHRLEELTVKAVREAIISHFNALQRPGGNAGGIPFEGAHLASHCCGAAKTLRIGLAEGAPKDCVPLAEFIGSLLEERDGKRVPASTPEEKTRRELVGWHARSAGRVAESIVRDARENPKVAAEAAMLDKCAVFLNPSTCAEQVEAGKKRKLRN